MALRCAHSLDVAALPADEIGAGLPSFNLAAMCTYSLDTGETALLLPLLWDASVSGAAAGTGHRGKGETIFKPFTNALAVGNAFALSVGEHSHRGSSPRSISVRRVLRILHLVVPE